MEIASHESRVRPRCAQQKGEGVLSGFLLARATKLPVSGCRLTKGSIKGPWGDVPCLEAAPGSQA